MRLRASMGAAKLPRPCRPNDRSDLPALVSGGLSRGANICALVATPTPLSSVYEGISGTSPLMPGSTVTPWIPILSRYVESLDECRRGAPRALRASNRDRPLDAGVG